MTKLRDEFATKAGPMLREMTFLGRTRRGQPASRSRTVRRSETRTSRASTRSSRTAQSRSSAAPRRDWRLPTRRRRPAAGRRPPLRSTWPGPQRARRSRISRLRRQGRAGEEGAGGSRADVCGGGCGYRARTARRRSTRWGRPSPWTASYRSSGTRSPSRSVCTEILEHTVPNILCVHGIHANLIVSNRGNCLE